MRKGVRYLPTLFGENQDRIKYQYCILNSDELLFMSRGTKSPFFISLLNLKGVND